MKIFFYIILSYLILLAGCKPFKKKIISVNISKYKKSFVFVHINKFDSLQKKENINGAAEYLTAKLKLYDDAAFKKIKLSQICHNTLYVSLDTAKFEVIIEFLRKAGFYDKFPVGDNCNFYPEILKNLPDTAIIIIYNKYEINLSDTKKVWATTDAGALSYLSQILEKRKIIIP